MSSVQKLSALGAAVATYFAIGCNPQAPATTIGVEKPQGGNTVTMNTSPTGTTPTASTPTGGQSPAPEQKSGDRTAAPPANGQAAPPATRQDAPPGPQPGGGQGQRGGGGGGFGRGGSIAFLVNNEQIKKELAITPDQVKKIEAAMPARGQGGPSAPGGAAGGQQQSPEERQKQREELQNKVEAILTPAQKTRIHEIQYQMSGVRAFSNPDVVKALAITPDQAKKLEAVMPQRGQGGPGGGAGGAGAPGGAGGGGGQQMSPEERQKQREGQMKKALDVLTPAQKAKWEKLKGKPFQMQFQPGGGAPQGGGAPGGGASR